MGKNEVRKRLEEELKDLEERMENGDTSIETISRRNDVSVALASVSQKKPRPHNKKFEKLNF
jgi:cell division septum initiation protein DivIVA